MRGREEEDKEEKEETAEEGRGLEEEESGCRALSSADGTALPAVGICFHDRIHSFHLWIASALYITGA